MNAHIWMILMRHVDNQSCEWSLGIVVTFYMDVCVCVSEWNAIKKNLPDQPTQRNMEWPCGKTPDYQQRYWISPCSCNTKNLRSDHMTVFALNTVYSHHSASSESEPPCSYPVLRLQTFWRGLYQWDNPDKEAWPIEWHIMVINVCLTSCRPW